MRRRQERVVPFGHGVLEDRGGYRRRGDARDCGRVGLSGAASLVLEEERPGRPRRGSLGKHHAGCVPQHRRDGQASAGATAGYTATGLASSSATALGQAGVDQRRIPGSRMNVSTVSVAPRPRNVEAEDCPWSRYPAAIMRAISASCCLRPKTFFTTTGGPWPRAIAFFVCSLFRCARPPAQMNQAKTAMSTTTATQPPPDEVATTTGATILRLASVGVKTAQKWGNQLGEPAGNRMATGLARFARPSYDRTTLRVPDHDAAPSPLEKYGRPQAIPSTLP
jgi:hypothetical protein